MWRDNLEFFLSTITVLEGHPYQVQVLTFGLNILPTGSRLFFQ
jgi:hypothetical protein